MYNVITCPLPVPAASTAGSYRLELFLLSYDLTLCMLGNFVCFFVVCGYFFFKLTFRNTIRVSNSLDADQARHFVGPGLGPNCLQRLLADDKSHN